MNLVDFVAANTLVSLPT